MNRGEAMSLSAHLTARYQEFVCSCKWTLNCVNGIWTRTRGFRENLRHPMEQRVFQLKFLAARAREVKRREDAFIKRRYETAAEFETLVDVVEQFCIGPSVQVTKIPELCRRLCRVLVCFLRQTHAKMMLQLLSGDKVGARTMGGRADFFEWIVRERLTSPSRTRLSFDPSMSPGRIETVAVDPADVNSGQRMGIMEESESNEPSGI